jgi:alkaline phosphatase D
MVWARADRPARMFIEAATTDTFKETYHASFADALPETDFTAKVLVEDLPPGQDIFYRLRFQDLWSPQAVSEPVVGRFRTASIDRRSISFVWSGDTAGQGWGIDTSRGGMRTYRTMLHNRPDFFVHCGDSIYGLYCAGTTKAAERRDVAKCRDRGKEQGRNEPRRLSRQL